MTGVILEYPNFTAVLYWLCIHGLDDIIQANARKYAATVNKYLFIRSKIKMQSKPVNNNFTYKLLLIQFNNNYDHEYPNFNIYFIKRRIAS